MEEYMEVYTEENFMEREQEAETTAEAAEAFPDTVSGNDAPETDLPLPEENGQGELLEKLDALVEALTPGEETEEPVEETEALPSETETAVLELLEKIYAETAAGRTADSLYYEACAETLKESQEAKEMRETYSLYITALLLGILFVCACDIGIQVAKTIWERFR